MSAALSAILNQAGENAAEVEKRFLSILDGNVEDKAFWEAGENAVKTMKLNLGVEENVEDPDIQMARENMEAKRFLSQPLADAMGGITTHMQVASELQNILFAKAIKNRINKTDVVNSEQGEEPISAMDGDGVIGKDAANITLITAIDYVFKNCPDFELAWNDGNLDEEEYSKILNDEMRQEIMSVCTGLGIYFFRLIQNEEHELAKQVALVLEEIHQSGDEKTVDVMVCYCYETLFDKAKQANIEIAEIEKYLHSESLNNFKFIESVFSQKK